MTMLRRAQSLSVVPRQGLRPRRSRRHAARHQVVAPVSHFILAGRRGARLCCFVGVNPMESIEHIGASHA